MTDDAKAANIICAYPINLDAVCNIRGEDISRLISSSLNIEKIVLTKAIASLRGGKVHKVNMTMGALDVVDLALFSTRVVNPCPLYSSCCIFLCRKDYIIILFRGAMRFHPLGCTSLRNSR